MKTTSIGFIGAGRITRIFLQAFTNKEIQFEKVFVFDSNNEVAESLKKQFPFIETTDLICVASQSIVFIALHPPVIMETLQKTENAIQRNTTVVSLAPKITIAKIASILKTGNIARMIPNATSYINQGYNPISFSNDFDLNDKADLLSMLELLGNTFEVDEQKLEAYAILSAMLPTYFWFQWNELIKIGAQIGLSNEESKSSVQNTLIAAIRLMFDSGLSPEKVIDLIPVKPIGESEALISEIYQTKLTGLFEKIKS